MNSIMVHIRSHATSFGNTAQVYGDTAQVYGNAANTGSEAGKLIATSGPYNKLLEII